MIVYDIECIRPPVPRQGQPLGNYLYAQGWEDYKGMGIAVCVWYDYMTDQFYYFTEDDIIKDGNVITYKQNAEIFQSTIKQKELVCGFNINKYDNNMLKAHGFNIKDDRCYDIYRHWMQSVGLNPDVWNVKTHSGYSLDAMLSANSFPAKTGNGADAPYMWQDGRKQEVINYCIEDVRRELWLLNKIFETGGLVSPKTKEYVKMAIPCL